MSSCPDNHRESGSFSKEYNKFSEIFSWILFIKIQETIKQKNAFYNLHVISSCPDSYRESGSFSKCKGEKDADIHQHDTENSLLILTDRKNKV